MKSTWHIWLVGIVTLLWNLMGAFDFTMTHTGNEKYLAQFTQEQLDYFRGFPFWVNISWAVAVFTSVIGSILILFRSGLAVPVLLISLLAMVVTSIHNFILSDVKMNDIAGPEAIYFSIVIFVVALLLWLYARWLKATGRLR